ncbi:hypothetical protein JANAI62_21540 [Jannaschia pagri]|uniref:Uncharacterized protein n=1 Tax=Jannaschia pagri TaxID=2829797 RepID=A0ABQ4NM93_9RHOB|nr:MULTISPECIES: DUF6502 family protein [unclassified Jannaschia]GIT91697.1 hypothetical protein JANAI61_21550 [Jannaschia sp. AI_61]GIT95531.1 hypothetical protein JANAI62_21540 [Jannaschia sp. AI_62]
MGDTDPFSKAGAFDRAIRRILRPLVRALISQNVTVTAFYRLVKQTYVEVATEMLGQDGTDSRISVMTGVHRRDVKAFRSLSDTSDQTDQRKASMLSTVVGRWLSSTGYVDADGRPVPIPRNAEAGPSFEALVQSVSRDVRPRTVLDELARQGILTIAEDRVHLLLEGLVAPADMDQRLHFFAHNLGDHVDAAVTNILSDTPPHLERAVFYNALDAEALRDVEAEARAIATDALRRVNAKAAALQTADPTDPEASHRFRFGIFFYSEDETAQTQPAKTEGQEPDDDQ